RRGGRRPRNPRPGGRRAFRRAGAAPRHRRKLSRPQGQHHLPRIPERAAHRRGRNPAGAALLQRRGAQSQRRGRILPLQSRGQCLPLRGGGVFRAGERGRARRARRQVHLTPSAPMRFGSGLFALLALVLFFALPAVAREEIRAFASDVTLRTDGSVRVIETLDVQAEGNEIRRGIYRDIPVTMVSDRGNRIRVALNVVSVERDGAPEPFRVERMGDFQRIWIGDPDRFVTWGPHRYVVTYT